MNKTQMVFLALLLSSCTVPYRALRSHYRSFDGNRVSSEELYVSTGEGWLLTAVLLDSDKDTVIDKSIQFSENPQISSAEVKNLEYSGDKWKLMPVGELSESLKGKLRDKEIHQRFTEPRPIHPATKTRLKAVESLLKKQMSGHLRND